MIGIALVESKNGPFRPVQENYIAALLDASQRFRLAHGFGVATGFSGAARASSFFAIHTLFGGVILQGAGTAGPQVDFTRKNPACCVYGILGIGDFNVAEGPGLVARLPDGRFSLQSGGHAPAQLAAFDEGLTFVLDAIYTQRENTHKNAMEQYVVRFRILHQRIRGHGPHSITMYEALEAANRIAIARKFSTDPTLADDKQLQREIVTVARMLEELPRHPAVSIELEARAVFNKVRDEENAKWPANVRDLTAFAKQCAVEYDAVAAKFPNTLYGKKAAGRAAWLAKGVEKEKGG
ncbi:MAG: hypothetical protein FWD53_10680 [Phycisphaerales bacterium]|nr:hypothetical protein [Phycisphaerales bacterium]